jgi:hypothetical protein
MNNSANLISSSEEPSAMCRLNAGQLKVAPLIAHAVGHTVIRATVGAHELHICIGDTDMDSDYDSLSSVSCWTGCFPLRYDTPGDTSDLEPFINQLCIHVAGYVGEAALGDADSLVATSSAHWFRVGRSELQDAHDASRFLSIQMGISASSVLATCMEVVYLELLANVETAVELCKAVSTYGSVDDFRLASILAGIKEVDLSQKVLKGLEQSKALVLGRNVANDLSSRRSNDQDPSTQRSPHDKTGAFLKEAGL